MKKKIFIMSALITAVTVLLTSCRVNWYDRHYDVPWWVIAVPVIIFSAVTLFAGGQYIASKKFICPNCYKTFHPKWWKAMLSIHVNDDRLFKCPYCGKKGFCYLSRDRE